MTYTSAAIGSANAADSQPPVLRIANTSLKCPTLHHPVSGFVPPNYEFVPVFDEFVPKFPNLARFHHCNACAAGWLRDCISPCVPAPNLSDRHCDRGTLTG